MGSDGGLLVDRAEYAAAQRREIEWAYTHESAQAAIRAAVPGAEVKFRADAESTERGRFYEISADRLVRRLPDGTVTKLALTGAYMLPAPVKALMDDAHNTITEALRAIR